MDHEIIQVFVHMLQEHLWGERFQPFPLEKDRISGGKAGGHRVKKSKYALDMKNLSVN